MRLRLNYVFKTVCFFLAFVVSDTIWCQQNIQTTQYMLNTLSYNPGFAGLSNGICASLLYRNQWTTMHDNIKGDEKVKVNPWNAMLLVDAPIKVLKGALSMEILSDNLGHFNDIQVKVGYTYHLQTSIGKLGMGVQGAFLNKKIKYSNFNPPTTSGDPILEAKNEESAFFGDVSVGAYLQGTQDYFVGLAVSNIIPQYNADLGYRIDVPLVTLNGGYTFGFPSLPKVKFTATTLLQTDFKAVKWDISALATFNQRFWAGLSYSLLNSVSVLAGINISHFRVGVAYDLPASRIIHSPKMAGSFEVFVKYCFGLDADKLNTEYKNARYL